MNRRFYLILLLCFLTSPTSLAFDCKELNVGTIPAPKEATGDIIREGSTSNFWVFGSSTPIITVQSKAIQFFYISNTSLKLTSENIGLKYDNDLFASTTYTLLNSAPGSYEIEVTYNCAEFGGALITYTLTVAVPECGTGAFSWKKVCGYPLNPKDGLMVEMTYPNFTEIVVRNGLKVNTTYYDLDIQAFSLFVPEFAKTASFRIFMQHDDSEVHPAYQLADAATISTNSTTGNTTDVVKNNTAVDIYKLFPTTRISIPEIDSDEDVVGLKMTGNGTQGGTVDNKTSLNIDVEFTCKTTGIATVELIIPLDYFRDIVLFFMKDCKVEASSSFGTFFWLIMILIVVFSYLTYKNMTVHGKNGVEAIPFYDQAVEIMDKLQGIKFKQLMQIPYEQTRGADDERAAKGEDKFEGVEDDEGEFKIENISEIKSSSKNPPKYGSLS